MRFDPRVEMKAPDDLYDRKNGANVTRVRPEYTHLFTHSASSSFLAYIPLYFWQQVVNECNAYARIKGINLVHPVTLPELMKFIGILFFMTITDRGEYSNYWGPQPEDVILGNQTSLGLEKVMPLRRFKLLRKVFCFRAAPPSPPTDPAARIRPLLNLLKCTGGKYIELGQDVSLDECSIACRSKFGRHVIVYNPMKPTGKYHFRLYVLCCGTTWIAVNYRFHCSSTIADRLQGVVPSSLAEALSEELAIAKVSAIRKLVLEVVRPLYGSNRIVNMDNYYTSVQLLQALRLKGLYARGTVRGTSKHFPKHTILDKNSATRGDYRQGVSSERSIVAASWCDGSIVQVISNADSSVIGTVDRQVGATKQSYPAPTCVKEYNAHMQGVDKLDQTRARFSIADGHSFKPWHKKLALGLIDIARSNAYLTRRQVVDMSKDRDSHRDFMIQLSSELISGKWVDAPSDGRIAFDAVGSNEPIPSPVLSTAVLQSIIPDGSPHKRCVAVTSRQALGECSRKRRACVVCRWEDRYATEKTDYCGRHNVCLCRGVYQQEIKPYMCAETDLTCWEKFHRYYVPNQLFSEKGNLRTSSALYKLNETSMVPSNAPAEQPRPRAARSIVSDLNDTSA